MLSPSYFRNFKVDLNFSNILPFKLSIIIRARVHDAFRYIFLCKEIQRLEQLLLQRPFLCYGREEHILFRS